MEKAEIVEEEVLGIVKEREEAANVSHVTPGYSRYQKMIVVSTPTVANSPRFTRR